MHSLLQGLRRRFDDERALEATTLGFICQIGL